MKKVLYGLMLVVALGLLCAGTTLAVPVGPSGEGLSVFADYDSWWYDTHMVGAGYGFTENLTAGVFYVPDWEEFGIFANAAFGPFRLNGELVFEEYCNDGIFSVLYAFDLDPITLAVGGGMEYCEEDGFDYFFIDATAEFKLDALTVYGGVMFYPDDSDWTSFKIGVAYTF